MKSFKNNVRNIFEKKFKNSKSIYITGDLNLNILDFDKNKRIKDFFSMFEHYDSSNK